MKRAVSAVLTILTLATPIVAQAEWVTKEIKWRISGLGPTGTSTSIYVRDTSYAAIGGNSPALDTTAEFSIEDAIIPMRGAGFTGGTGSATNVTGTGAAPYVQPDTCVVAWIVLQQDTTVAFTPTATSFTMFVDGRVGGFGLPATLARGWVKTDSTFINGAAGGTLTTGDESIAIPIRSISPYGNIFRWGQLRARISAPTATTMASCRVFLRYFRASVFQDKY